MSSSVSALPTLASTWNVSTACFGSDFHCSNYKLECSPNQEISIISASYGTKQDLPACISGVSDCIVGAACCVFNASDRLTPFSYADNTRLNQNCKGRSMCEAAAPRLGVPPFSSYVYINYTCSNSTYTILVSPQDSGTYNVYINSQFNSLQTNEKKTARISNRYNQVPHLSQDTYWESSIITINITNKSQAVSPFPSGDHMAAMNKHESMANTRHQ